MRAGRGVFGVLVGVALTLWLAAWMMANQPFSGPDEAPHYLRALSIANGVLVGPRVPNPHQVLAFAPPDQQNWVAQDLRQVRVPAGLSPPNIQCLNGQPTAQRPDCIEPSGTGDYWPFAYLLPAAALAVSNDTSTAIWLGRLAGAIPCAAFLMLAVALLFSGSGWSLLGLLAAVTPMSLYVGSVINPNGLEIAACLAFAAGLLRITRTPAQVPGWMWVASAVSGSVAILSFQLGWAFVLADIVVAAVLLGRRGLHQLISANRRSMWIAGVVLAAAFAAYLAYGLASGAAHGTFEIHPIRHSLSIGLNQLPYALRDSIFALITVHLPGVGYYLWWLYVVALVAAALWMSLWRHRLLMASVLAGALAFPVLFEAWVHRFTGFGIQGRYVLPILMLIPLVAGELIYRRQALASRTRWHLVLPAAAALIAVMQLAAWWQNARYAAGQPHAVWFLSHAVWSPPLGWWPWTALAIVGTVALMLAALALARESLSSRTIRLTGPGQVAIGPQ